LAEPPQLKQPITINESDIHTSEERQRISAE
jgi:hypothetical protein